MQRKLKNFLSTVLVLSMVWQMTAGILPVPVSAWKTKTHNYTAQLLMQEMQANYMNGAYYLEIPPYGKFMVPHEFANAIMEYPAAFSAGSQGPDAYPDLYVGQTFIHPYDSELDIGSGDWIEHMCGVVNSLPKGYARDEALALTLGFINHYCGDMFGHDYINSYAKGSFPNVLDGVDVVFAPGGFYGQCKFLFGEGGYLPSAERFPLPDYCSLAVSLGADRLELAALLSAEEPLLSIEGLVPEFLQKGQEVYRLSTLEKTHKY